MKKEIVTKNGVIVYEEEQMVSGTKRLNLEVAKENLLDLKRILDENKVKFSLIYGTLLGAIRENNFIAHDEDIDLAMLEEDKDSILSALQSIIEKGFKVLRYNDKLLSISRNNEYIDFYFFKKTSPSYRKCDVGLKAKATYLENTKSVVFLGENFQIPIEAENFLVELYGNNWKTPIENVSALRYNKYFKFREFIRNKTPYLFSIFSKIKKTFGN